MMKIEKDLAATDLNKYKKDPLENLVTNLYKYHKFKPSLILSKINCTEYSEGTVMSYLAAIKKYLRTNEKLKHTPSKLYDVLDSLVLQCYSVLTPSESDKCKIYKLQTHKSSAPTPTSQPTPVEPPKYTEQIPPQYGVWDGETIKLLSNKDVCDGYIKCYKEFSLGKPLVLVKVDFEVVENA